MAPAPSLNMPEYYLEAQKLEALLPHWDFTNMSGTRDLGLGTPCEPALSYYHSNAMKSMQVSPAINKFGNAGSQTSGRHWWAFVKGGLAKDLITTGCGIFEDLITICTHNGTGGRGWGSPLMRGSLFHTVCQGERWGDDIDDDGDQLPQFCTRCPPQTGPPFNMSCHLTCHCVYTWMPPPNCCGDFGIPLSCVEFVRMFLPFREQRYMCIKKYLTMDRYFLTLAS